MDNDRTDSALRRIAAAVERIEARAATDAGQDAERRYQALRKETEAALRQLDTLIAGLEG